MCPIEDYLEQHFIGFITQAYLNSTADILSIVFILNHLHETNLEEFKTQVGLKTEKKSFC